MKPSLTLASVLALCACRAPGQASENQLVGSQNLWTTRAYAEEAAYAAVIRERTLYAHHFVQDGAALNQLGQRDVHWLAQHYLEDPFGLPIDLNVRCAGVTEALYEKRLESVRAAFEQQGLDASLIAIGDGPPGGDGLASARVHAALTAEPAVESAAPTTTLTSGIMPFGSDQ